VAGSAILLHNLIPHHHHFNFGDEYLCTLSFQQIRNCEHSASETDSDHHCTEQKNQDDCNGCHFTVVSTDLNKIFKTNFLVSAETEIITICSTGVSTNVFVGNTPFPASLSVRIPQLRAPPVI
jgi:hypothetical protein